MQCSNVHDISSLYLDGLLSPEQVEMLEQHLAVCTECCSEIEALRHTIQALSALQVLDPPTEFRQQLMEKLEGELKRKSLWSRIVHTIPIYRWAAVACVALALVVTFQQVGRLKTLERLKLSPADRETQITATGEQDLLKTMRNVEGTNQIQMTTSVAKENLPDGIQIEDSGKEVVDDLSDNSLFIDEISLKMKETASDSSDNLSSTLETLNSVVDQKVVKKANLSLEVVNLEQSEKKVMKMIDTNGARNWFIKNSFRTAGRQGLSRGDYLVSVPQQDFYLAVDSMETLGVLKEKELSLEDVNQRYTDLTTRVLNFQSEENKLMETLGNPRVADENGQLQEELNQIRQNKQSVVQELEQLNNYIEYSTIQLILLENHLSGSGAGN